MKTLLRTGFVLAGLVSTLAAQSALSGRWEAQLKVDTDYSIPFPLEITESGGKVSASFFNGDERVTSTAGTAKDGTLDVDFAHYDSRLEARLENGVLKGRYGNARSGLRDFEARPRPKVAKTGATAAPKIAGVWDIPHESAKGEKAWRLIVRQAGAEVSAAILRVDGDTGALRGTWQGDRFVLNIFDGARGYTLDVVPQKEDSLSLTLRSLRGKPAQFTALRSDAARAKGLPPPTNADLHTRVKDPSEPFRFSFPDLNGKIVSDSDERFRNKVVIVNITGSWCPNCHDEAPFLQQLYSKYRALGLEVVAIDFEEAEQLKKLTRLPAFIKKYGVEYSYLVAGEPKELAAKIPQAENLNSWPTTFFIGRDGRVRAIHAGFAAPASGEFHTDLVAKITRTVETLLAENASGPVANQ